jgi:hypothetical protein
MAQGVLIQVSEYRCNEFFIVVVSVVLVASDVEDHLRGSVDRGSGMFAALETGISEVEMQKGSVKDEQRSKDG